MDLNYLRKALRAQPFRAFTMNMVGGRTIPVPHPDFVAMDARSVVFTDPRNAAVSVLEPVLITASTPEMGLAET